MTRNLMAALRRLRTAWTVQKCRKFLTAGKDLHIGAGARLWAPERLRIGDHVYLGKQVHIEANVDIGDFCLVANRVAIVGRHDHDFRQVGYPVRFAPWIGSSQSASSPFRHEKAVIEQDVWLGYGAIVLTGVVIGRGSIIAAGSVVTTDIPPYSIAAGVPARSISTRFPDPLDREAHELSLRHGRFAFSELGYDYSLIEPVLRDTRP